MRPHRTALDSRRSGCSKALLKGVLLMAFYSMRSDNLFCQRLDTIEGRPP